MSFNLHREDETPLYIQLADSIRASVLEGVFRPLDKLPSVRKLSDELGVNPATVVSAYRILTNEGLVEAKAGSGAFISGKLSSLQDLPKQNKNDSLSIKSSESEEANKIEYDLSSNSPARAFYPLDDIKEIIPLAIADSKVFDYQDASGFFPLKEIIANKFFNKNQSANGEVNPRDIHITSGAQQGIDLVSRILLRHGDVVAIESPGYPGIKLSCIASGARIEAIPLQNDGMDLDKLELIANKLPLRLVYINPDFQNPTGIVYSEEKRVKLAKMALQYGFYIIEDDAFSEIAYTNAKNNSVWSYANERVFYIKSFSKTVMPGLRIASVCAPNVFRDRLEQAKYSVDLSSNGLMQRVLELFLSKGNYDKHILKLLNWCKMSRDIFLLEFNNVCDAVVNGGLDLWLPLPNNLSGLDAEIISKKIACPVVAEANFRHENGKKKDTHIRVSFGSVQKDDALIASKKLKNALWNN